MYFPGFKKKKLDQTRSLFPFLSRLHDKREIPPLQPDIVSPSDISHFDTPHGKVPVRDLLFFISNFLKSSVIICLFLCRCSSGDELGFKRRRLRSRGMGLGFIDCCFQYKIFFCSYAFLRMRVCVFFLECFLFVNACMCFLVNACMYSDVMFLSLRPER